MNFEYHYIYLLFTFFLGIYFLAILLNKDWVLFPGDGKYNFDYFIKIFGRTLVRIFIGTLTLIGIGITFSLFYIQEKKININNLKLNNMNLEDYFEKIRQDPNLAYPILLGIAIFVFIGIIFDWDWIFDPRGNSKLRYHLELWGRKNVRIYSGITFLIIIICLSYIVVFNKK